MAMCSTRLIFMFVSSVQEMVTPLSTGYTCPVTIRDSSDARNTAMLAMSSGSISPTRCESASLSRRCVAGDQFAHAVGHRRRRRDGVDAHLCGANSTAIERVIAATPPFAAV